MRIKPDGYFIISLAMAFLSHAVFPVVQLIHYPYSLTGIILLILGVLLTFVANSTLLKRRTSIKPLGTPGVLITSGPFKFSRNPIYLGMTIALFGVATILGSLLPFIFPIIFAVIINRLFVPGEEDTLAELFGKEYLDYKAKVRRWI